MGGRVDWLMFGRGQGAGFGLRRSSFEDAGERARWEGRLVSLAEPRAGVGTEGGGSVCRLVWGDKVIVLHRSPVPDSGSAAPLATYAYIGEGARFEPREVLVTAGLWQGLVPAPGGRDGPIDADRLPPLTPRMLDEVMARARRPPHDALRRLTAEVLRDPGRGFSCRLSPGAPPKALMWGLMDLLGDVVGDGSGRYWTFSTAEADDVRSRLPRFVFLDEWRHSRLQPSHFRLDLTGPPPPGDDPCLRAADVLLDAYLRGSAESVGLLLRRTGAARGRLGEPKRIARLLAFAEGMGVPVAGDVPGVSEEGEPTVERRLPDVSALRRTDPHPSDTGPPSPSAPRPREPYPFERPASRTRRPYEASSQPFPAVPPQADPGSQGHAPEGAGPGEQGRTALFRAVGPRVAPGPGGDVPVEPEVGEEGDQERRPGEQGWSGPEPSGVRVREAGPGESSPGEVRPEDVRVAAHGTLVPPPRSGSAGDGPSSAEESPVVAGAPVAYSAPEAAPAGEPAVVGGTEREDHPADDVSAVGSGVAESEADTDTDTGTDTGTDTETGTGTDTAAEAAPSASGAVSLVDVGETIGMEEAEAETAPLTRSASAGTVHRRVSEPMPQLVERLGAAGTAAEMEGIVDDIAAAAEQGGKASRAELRALFVAGGFFRERLAAMLSEQEAERVLRGLTAHAFTDDDPAVLLQAVKLAAEPGTPEAIREALLEVVVVNGGARVWLDNYRPAAPATGPVTAPVPKPAVAPPRPRRTLAVALKEPSQGGGRFSEFALLAGVVVVLLLLGSAVIFLAGSL
ncbi:hypothetical protein AB0K60_11445 [Thermopolyspora sp. NPDC052614]|uniref:hypothetical protein n=1 Tax=Thermopolyspora sp. NPDC052614 TaxID=3155682 RepID=UPI003420D68A